MKRPPLTDSTEAAQLRQAACEYGDFVGEDPEDADDTIYVARNRALLNAALRYAKRVESAKGKP